MTLKTYYILISVIGGIKKIIILLLLLNFLTFCDINAQSKKHEIGIDPGDFIQLFSSNQDIKGLNYKYSISEKYKLRLGGYYKTSSNSLQGGSYDIRIGFENIKNIGEKINLFYGIDFSKYCAFFNNRENITKTHTIAPLIGVQIRTLKNIAVSLDYKFPFSRTNLTDLNNFSNYQNTVEQSVSFFDSSNLTISFIF